MNMREAKGKNYIRFLADIHASIQPKAYLEVGTMKGKSLEVANCFSVSVDPSFRNLENVFGIKPAVALFQQTSDDFFKSDVLDKMGTRFDFAFLDGMHLYEYLLRDFMNAEKYMTKNGVVALHDCMPSTIEMAKRDRTTTMWTGDVWKVVPILQEYRPDLKITLYDAAPTGLVIIENLDPGNTILNEKYEEIISKYDKVSGVESIVNSFEVHPTQNSPWAS